MGYITGNTGVKNNFFQTQVMIHEFDTGKLVTEFLSNEDGSYRFDGLNHLDKYVITAIDVNNFLENSDQIVSHVIYPYKD